MELPRAHVAHEIKGRVRIRMPSVRRHPARLEQIRKALEGMDGVRSAEANPLTGSIVLQYDAAGHPSANGRRAGTPVRAKPPHDGFRQDLAAFAAGTQLFNLLASDEPDYDEVAKGVETDVEYLAKHSKTAARIDETVKRWNLALKRASDNNLDLNVVVPLGLGVCSAAALGYQGGTPLWVTLALNALNHFARLQTTKDQHSGRPAAGPGQAPAGSTP